jgi:hypothetical protein
MQVKLPLLTIAAVGLAVGIWGPHLGHSAEADINSPVLVELFTSEGCSSCPPADALLERLDAANSPGSPQVIVLSEHVDYFNSADWNDPYSSPAFTQRQSIYVKQFHLNDVYTPEMVVDGAAEFVGSDSHAARAKISAAAAGHKPVIPILLNPVSPGSVQVEIPATANTIGRGSADVMVAIASNEASTQVLGGENGGRKLHHVAVVRSIASVGQIRDGKSFSKEIRLGHNGGGQRVIAWVQQSGQGRVLGSAMRVW